MSTRWIGGTGWWRPIGCIIFVGQFPQKGPIVSGSFAERDLQFTVSRASSPLCFRLYAAKCNVFVRVVYCRRLRQAAPTSRRVTMRLEPTPGQNSRRTISLHLSMSSICNGCSRLQVNWLIDLCITGWRRPIGCLTLHFPPRERATNSRALLRKITCKDQAFYASSPLCNVCKTCVHQRMQIVTMHIISRCKTHRTPQVAGFFCGK